MSYKNRPWDIGDKRQKVKNFDATMSIYPDIDLTSQEIERWSTGVRIEVKGTLDFDTMDGAHRFLKQLKKLVDSANVDDSDFASLIGSVGDL